MFSRETEGKKVKKKTVFAFAQLNCEELPKGLLHSNEQSEYKNHKIKEKEIKIKKGTNINTMRNKSLNHRKGKQEERTMGQTVVPKAITKTTMFQKKISSGDGEHE